jgi:hypothetical protein
MLARLQDENNALRATLGRTVQVDPIKPKLKAPGAERLKPKYEEVLSNFGFKFNSRRYSWGRRGTCRPRLRSRRNNDILVFNTTSIEPQGAHVVNRIIQSETPNTYES